MPGANRGQQQLNALSRTLYRARRAGTHVHTISRAIKTTTVLGEECGLMSACRRLPLKLVLLSARIHCLDGVRLARSFDVRAL
jgi:hypothetical protein